MNGRLSDVLPKNIFDIKSPLDAAQIAFETLCLEEGLSPREQTRLRLIAALRAAESHSTTEAVEKQICDDIVGIHDEYLRQQQQTVYVDTPGGLEHMGDVWNLISEWGEKLDRARKEG